MTPGIWIAIILLTAVWIGFIIMMVRDEKRAAAERRRKYDALKAWFDSLPTPKDKP